MAKTTKQQTSAPPAQSPPGPSSLEPATAADTPTLDGRKSPGDGTHSDTSASEHADVGKVLAADAASARELGAAHPADPNREQPTVVTSERASATVGDAPAVAPGSSADEPTIAVENRADAGAATKSDSIRGVPQTSDDPTLDASSPFVSDMPLEAFAQNLSSSGLMTSDEFKAVCDSLPPNDTSRNTTSLVNELVRRKRLTRFQAAQLCHGNTTGLSYGNYVVLDELGAGGMGVVFRAQHRRMKRVVALKVLPAETMKSEVAIQRFHREVEAAAKLTHPNIVAAYDADESDGVHFLVMEYVEGENFTQLVRRVGPLAVDRAIDLCLQTARGLLHAHERGIVHRDIKPSNLLIDPDGIVKILDMGLARMRAPDDSDAEGDDLTQSGRVMGTVDYMAPEQALDAKRADHRADIYSLGCTLHFLLTGNVLSPPGAMTKKLLWHQSGQVPSLCELRSDAPKSLDNVFQTMLAKRPEDRQQTMEAVIAQLTACLEEVGGAMTQIDIPSGSRSAADVPTLASGTMAGATLSDRSNPDTVPARVKSRVGLLVGTAVVLTLLAVGAFAALGRRAGDSDPEADAPLALANAAPGAAVAAGADTVADGGDAVASPPPDSDGAPVAETATRETPVVPVVPAPAEPSPAERLANWVHTYGGTLILQTADGTRLNDVANPEDLPEGDYTVRGVSLARQTMRGADWDLLGESRSVETVSLAETDVDNDVVGQIAGMPAAETARPGGDVGQRRGPGSVGSSQASGVAQPAWDRRDRLGDDGSSGDRVAAGFVSFRYVRDRRRSEAARRTCRPAKHSAERDKGDR
ncbi:MAG: protein kinase [Pirellulales bacterium]